MIEANRAAGDTEAHALSRNQLIEREPSLNPDAKGGVVVPREVVVEPWLIPIAYAHAAQLHGANIFTGENIVAAELQPSQTQGAQGGTWVLQSASGRTFRARTVVNCAGLFGDDLEHSCLLTPPPFEIRPRKGQFVVLDPDDVCPSHVLQPVPTQHSKGVFVWTSLWGTVVVGPTAEDQESKPDRSINANVENQLRAYGSSLVPGLATARVVGAYSGLRPATQWRDYQIRAVADKSWISVAGIRSTGLTASPAIAEFVAFLYANMHSQPLSKFAPEYLDTLRKNAALVEEESASSSASASPSSSSPHPSRSLTFTSPAVDPPYASVPLCPPVRRANAPIPSMEELALDYAARGDGNVQVFGDTWMVTHGLTRLGLESMARRLKQQQQQ